MLSNSTLSSNSTVPSTCNDECNVVAPPTVAPAETPILLVVIAAPTVKLLTTSRSFVAGLYLIPASTPSSSPNTPTLFSTKGKK